jgi:hypothetical protein
MAVFAKFLLPSLHAFIFPGVELNLLHKWEVSGSNFDQET